MHSFWKYIHERKYVYKAVITPQRSGKRYTENRKRAQQQGSNLFTQFLTFIYIKDGTGAMYVIGCKCRWRSGTVAKISTWLPLLPKRSNFTPGGKSIFGKYIYVSYAEKWWNDRDDDDDHYYWNMEMIMMVIVILVLDVAKAL